MDKEIDSDSKVEVERPYPQEILDYLRVLSEQGIDFEESDLEHLEAMDDEELTEYFFQVLLEAGIDDPEGFMVQHNLVEGFRKHTEEELIARRSRQLRGVGHKVDILDEQDRQKEDT